MTTRILIIIFAIIFVLILIFSATSYSRMFRLYKKYDKEFVYCNMNGLEFARWAIRKLRLKTQIFLIERELDDFYAPKEDHVYLSNHTANTSSVSSICITAHELGHAVQQKRQTRLYVLQYCLSILSRISMFLFPFLLLAGIVLICIPGQYDVGIIMFIASLVSIVITFLLKIFTIPMEMEASKIAYNFLKENNILDDEELKHGKKVLNAAIGTYVASLFAPIFKFFRRIGRAFKRWVDIQ